MPNSRSLLMDNLKGVLILLVVFAHFLIDYVDAGTTSLPVAAVYFFIYSFHMPLFVFISGFYSKNIDKVRATAFERLLIPYLLFNTCMVVYCLLVQHIWFGLFTPAYVNWYLLALFVWRVLLRDLAAVKLIVWWSLAGAVAIGFNGQADNFLAIARIFAFLPFFLLGYFSDNSVIAKIRTSSKLLAGVGLTACICLVGLLTSKGVLATRCFIAMPYSSPTDIGVRIAFYFLAVYISCCLLVLCPASRIRLLTAIGRNSLLVFLLHRYITFAFNAVVPVSAWRDWLVIPVLGLTYLTALTLGSNLLAAGYENALRAVTEFVRVGSGNCCLSGPRRRLVIVLLAFVVSAQLLWGFGKPCHVRDELDEAVSLPVLDRTQQANLESSITISFVGDLILLEDQVKHAWGEDSRRFDFAPVFQASKSYLSESDYSIGVLEVPLAGPEAGFSRGNYSDGLPTHLNAPDQWAEAIQAAGIDLVTTANNHCLDKGERGLVRTLDVLDNIGLSHVGTYRSTKERETVFIADIRGLKVAFLAYTFGVNYVDDRKLGPQACHWITCLGDPRDQRRFADSRQAIANDVSKAKQRGAELIVALPHMGTQFSHDADAFSRKWAQTMLSEGVDVVLADHSHAVQPLEEVFVTDRFGKRRRGLVLYSPGNFVNRYLQDDGDAAAIVNLHVSSSASGEPVILGASVTPIWIYRPGDGQYQALPIYEALTNRRIGSTLSSSDWGRIDNVHRLVTRVLLGSELSLDQIQRRYYVVSGKGYMRQSLQVNIKGEIDPTRLDGNRSRLVELLRRARRTVVIGDSISEGTKNGGYPWFEPMQGMFVENEFVNRSAGGATTASVLAQIDRLLDVPGDVFIIALGTNDVRYRDKRSCAMTALDYVANMKRIRQAILDRNPAARIVFVNPWLAFENDVHTDLEETERDRLIEEYGTALTEFAAANNDVYIEANTHIREFLGYHVKAEYILDHIHPNARQGVILYCNAVLFGRPDEWRISP